MENGGGRRVVGKRERIVVGIVVAYGWGSQ